MDQLIAIDQWLLLAINGLNNEYVDPFMKAFSGRFIWVFLYVAIAGVMLWKYGWRRALIFVAAVGIAVGLSDYTCASLIRPYVQRLRPSNLENEISAMVHIVDGYRSGSYGFPSCHACNTFALAVFTSLLVRERAFTVFIMLWAVLQCYSRVYLGVHYPGDIAVGALIGSAFSYGIYCLLIRYVKLTDPNPKANSLPAIYTGIALTIFLIIKSLI